MKTPELIFNDDGVRLVAGRDEYALDAPGFSESLSRLFLPSGIFQPALRWLSPSGHAAIMERPPFIARVSYRPGVAGDVAAEGAQHYNLPVPWTVYGIVFDTDFGQIAHMYVYVRNAPILDATSTLHMFPYPNVFNTSEACLGKDVTVGFAKQAHPTVAACIAHALTAFWTADFNEDAGEATWYATWRAPVNSITDAGLRNAVLQEGVTPWKLLRYYSEVALEHFLKYQFPLSNGFNPQGDTLEHLMSRLVDLDPVQIQTTKGMYAALRHAFAKG